MYPILSIITIALVIFVPGTIFYFAVKKNPGGPIKSFNIPDDGRKAPDPMELLKD